MQTITPPSVTVIVPVYNVSSYIEKCARSIFSQSLGSLEIIFIDDCSLDNSLEIIERTLKDFPSRNSQTRIIKMPTNGGLAAVRRRGIIEATGDYIIHCDGDDWVDIELYEKLYNQAVKDNADISICDFKYEYSHRTDTLRQIEFPKMASDALKNWHRSFFHMSTCNKLVRRRILIDNDILPWPNLNMWEDNGLMFRIFSAAKRITQIHSPYYHYNKVNDSAMSASYGRKQIEQMISIAKGVKSFFESRGTDVKYADTLIALQFYAKINLITDNFKGLNEYRKIFPGCEKIASKLDSKSFSLRGQIRWIMVRYHLSWLFIILFKVRKIFIK